ncbi:MAG: methylenetetrahydrofolate reductase C-terminal domain-containing protein [Pseudomonadota bacterium]
MIVGQQKPIAELLSMLEGCNKILLVGCKGCVTICNAGGSKEVAILASVLRIARKKQGKPIQVDELTLDRQCEPEFIEQLHEPITANQYDAVMSIACSIGPQYIAATFDTMLVFPGLNTNFLGGTAEHGIWKEYCAACGNCILDKTGGLCPIARCSKRLLNGPCGGSQNGKCEISSDIDCVWHLIYERLKKLNRLDKIKEIFPAKNWSSSLHGGPRKIIREDLTL